MVLPRQGQECGSLSVHSEKFLERCNCRLQGAQTRHNRTAHRRTAQVLWQRRYVPYGVVRLRTHLEARLYSSSQRTKPLVGPNAPWHVQRFRRMMRFRRGAQVKLTRLSLRPRALTRSNQKEILIMTFESSAQSIRVGDHPDEASLQGIDIMAFVIAAIMTLAPLAATALFAH